jgi:hypothetical protein
MNMLKGNDAPPTTQDTLPASDKGLVDLYEETHETLYRISTVSPFVLFPDEIIIRRNHVDVIKRVFFDSAQSYRMPYTNIREMVVTYNPFFATFEFMLVGPYLGMFGKINFLPRGRAIRANRIITGLIECQQLGVDTSHYPKSELLAYLDGIGKTQM